MPKTRPAGSGLQPTAEVIALRKVVLAYLADNPGAQAWQLRIQAANIHGTILSNSLRCLCRTGKIYRVSQDKTRFSYYLNDQVPVEQVVVDPENPIVKRRPKSQWKKWPGPVRSPMGWTAHELGAV